MRQLRIKIMNAPAAVTPMTIMAATAKSKYAVERSSSSATSGSLCVTLAMCANIMAGNDQKTSTSYQS
jgi:hypothetical protein